MLRVTRYKLHGQQGFTLLEVLLAIGIFLIFILSIFFTYGNLLEVMGKTRTRTLATTLLNREIESIRDLEYDEVGIVGGYPVGVIPAQKVVVYEGTYFLVKAYVRNTDDAFDGVTGGSPNDTAPADYRLVHLEVECPTCFGFSPVQFTTWVGPENLETTSNNGSLFINAFDASGIPVSGAKVKVINNSTTPTITITDTTNVSGVLQPVDIPTSTTNYQITVSKTGYSTSATYTPGLPANPNPLQPHATVASQQITEISFAIDKVSTLIVNSQDDRCAAVPSLSFNLNGTKLIGSGPDVLKYSKSHTTDSAGLLTLNSLEWDTYRLTNTSASYDLAGTLPLLPLTLNPNSTAALTLVVEPATAVSLLVSVIDASSSPLRNASVNLTKTGVDLTRRTGERFFLQTDWSGAQYSSQDGNLDDANPAGEIHLIQIGGNYPTSTNSFLISNTFDAGTATSTKLKELAWTPTSQPSNTSLKFQIASSNSASTTWSYMGPDGTGSTYYDTSTSTIGAMHDDRRYFRYKAFLNTDDPTVTPLLRDLSISFESSCIPSGQALFPGLSTGSYTVTVSKSGYSTATSSVTVASGWQETTLTMQ